MSTFITRFATSGPGVRLAVKDLIDMEGVPTTAGCRAVANEAVPAAADATCLAGARAAGARIVGRTNLHELALGVTGVNPWYGTPAASLTVWFGGSSSGSAVAVATGEADVAYGSDTGGSVRIPAACCGTTGLKTTWRFPSQGVWPLSPSFDTGPMARDVAGLVVGMELLEPGFVVATHEACTGGAPAGRGGPGDRRRHRPRPGRVGVGGARGGPGPGVARRHGGSGDPARGRGVGHRPLLARPAPGRSGRGFITPGVSLPEGHQKRRTRRFH